MREQREGSRVLDVDAWQLYTGRGDDPESRTVSIHGPRLLPRLLLVYKYIPSAAGAVLPCDDEGRK